MADLTVFSIRDTNYPFEYWKATHTHTGEVTIGTWEEIAELDNRVYNKELLNNTPKSHNPVLENPPLAYVYTYTRDPVNFILCNHWLPIWSLKDLERKVQL
jgi:hypothetical protein